MLTQRMRSPFSALLFAGGTTDSWRDCGGRDAGRGCSLRRVQLALGVGERAVSQAGAHVAEQAGENDEA